MRLRSGLEIPHNICGSLEDNGDLTSSSQKLTTPSCCLVTRIRNSIRINEFKGQGRSGR